MMNAGYCPICRASLRESFTATVLRRHEATYDYCDACGFLRARAPYWLDEAYASSIAITDTGLLRRNQTIARQLSVLFTVLGHDAAARYLDWAGGYGVLTRLMRDVGLDCYWADKFSANLLAPGFEYTPEVGSCRAVTAFEVLEHVEDPLAFVAEALAAGQSDTLIVSTELYSGAPPKPGDWWYYSFETGQHIAFYRRDTLQRLAVEAGLNFHSSRGLHIFSRRALPRARIDLALGKLNRLFAVIANRRRTGRTDLDHQMMVQRLAADAAR